MSLQHRQYRSIGIAGLHRLGVRPGTRLAGATPLSFSIDVNSR
jgi:hypothetical protein